MQMLLSFSAEMSTSETSISYSKLYFGGIEGGEIIPSAAPGLKGSMTQVYFNGQQFFELSRAGQLDAKLKENNNASLGMYFNSHNVNNVTDGNS